MPLLARIPGLQSREQFLTLVGLEVEAFNSLRRRDQLPQRPAYELSEEEADARGWSPISALAMIVGLELADRYALSRTRAAEIASRIDSVQSRWTDISETSLQQAGGREPDFYVLFASVDLPRVKPTMKRPDPTVVVGTLRDIATEYPQATGIIAVSVTGCAALMRQRAARAKIDLEDFWSAPNDPPAKGDRLCGGDGGA